MGFPHIVMRTGSGMLQNTLIRNGQCAALLVMDYARRTFRDRTDILYFPLSGDGNRCACGIFHRSGEPLSRYAGLFIGLARDYFRAQAPGEGELRG